MVASGTGARQAKTLNRTDDLGYTSFTGRSRGYTAPMRYRTAIVVVALLSSTALIVTGVGCAADSGSVPASAMLTAEGARRLPYTTSAPGTLYVYDKTASNLVYCGEVDAGRQILVDPDANRISADGQTLLDKKLISGHTYRIFFEPRATR
jgi:hypothetical protein